LQTSLQGAFAALVVALVLAAALWLPAHEGEDSRPSSRVTDRLDRLEAEQKRIGRVVSNLSADLAQVDTRSEGSAAQLAAIMPPGALWVDLSSGGNAQWELGEAGRARIEFLSLSEASPPLPQFRVTHRGGQISVELAAGQTMRAVDDQGARQVVYLTTLHRLRLDRKGYPEAALLSISTER
jgi:hypothetical protein